MEQADNFNQLFAFLESEGIGLSSLQQNKLLIYHKALVSYAAKHNIISKKDIAHIVGKHFISSFYFVKEIGKSINQQNQILDLGSGAGFPGIILAICFADNRVTMVDSTRKKALFLKRVIEEIEVEAVIINDRIENYLKRTDQKFDFITARALASINTLVELTRPLLNESVLHTIKGDDFLFEIYKREKEIKITPVEINQSWRKYTEYLNNKVYLTISSS